MKILQHWLCAASLLCVGALPAIAQTLPAGASQKVTLNVPPDMAGAPLNEPRQLTIPAGFTIGVFARVPKARFMAVAPNGDVLVSSPGAGTITLLRPGSGKSAAQNVTFASGLRNPHDIVFHVLGATTYVYIAESNRIIRSVYTNGQMAIGAIDVIVDALPDNSTPELKGSYGHQLKNIALNGAKLYVSIASTCNACASDTVSDPVRSAVYEYDADGKNRRLYAQGLRNAVGVRFRPGTNELWAVVNNRDNIAYPFHKDWDGDGSDDYGKIMQSYVDGHPPDLLTKVRDGGNYGWPFCNSNPDAGLDNMPYDRDVQLNADGSKLDCDKADRITRGLAPHSAPLGLNFLQGSALPPAYRNALVTALHGCWNCSAFNGHKVVLFPFLANGALGPEIDLVTGWVTNAAAKQRWGRPVTAVPDGRGSLYISDDFSGAVYLLSAVQN